MKKNLNLFQILYYFLFGISSSIVGAIIASWPLLFIFVLLQKTNELVHLSIFKVMHNYNQLMFYLLNPFKTVLKMDDFSTSKNAAEHFADCKNPFVFSFIIFIFCVIIFYY